MIDIAFWHYLDERVKGGSLTRAHVDQCLYDLPAAAALLGEFAKHDVIEMGEMVQECLKAFIHHKEIIHKKG